MTARSQGFDIGTLSGALLLSFAFGSIHAFGVLLAPLQISLQSDRASVSLVYSLAIASLTAGVYTSRYLGSRGSPKMLTFASGLVGSCGLLLAAYGPGLYSCLLGYGLVFGFCNGVAYSITLEQAAAAAPAQSGLMVGLATAAYGAGAAAYSYVLGPIATQDGSASALVLLAAHLVAASLLAGCLLQPAVEGLAPQTKLDAKVLTSVKPTARLWLIYFLGVSGGLMAIAHGPAIASQAGASVQEASWASILMALGSIAGSVFGGTWMQRVGARIALMMPILLSLFAHAGLLLASKPDLVLTLLLLCGIAYGALIAAIPVIVRKLYGDAAFNAVFGRIFSAWGMAGLLAPAVAGSMYDATGHYTFALWGSIALAGLALALTVGNLSQDGSKLPTVF